MKPMDLLADRLTKLLAERRSTIRTEWEARQAAVLIPIYNDDGEWHLVYTRRTEQVEQHRGQVSFPGGLVEERDQSAQETALREAEEEIGLKKETVQILGSLDWLLTVTQFQILPFIGLIPWPYSFQPNTDEVARIFNVPLRWLMDPGNLELRYRLPTPQGPEVPVYYFKPFEDEIIWGATARITLNLLDILKSLLEVD
jgi:8-oxo-dGTP pyrophosphatase MutT (NUDIX family)